MREQLVNSSFCKTLVERLNDPFIQVRYNSAMAIINLIVCFSESDIDCIFVFECGLLAKLEELFNEYSSGQVTYTESEIDKINKLLKSVFDLISLVVELYDEEKGFNKLNFNNIVKFTVGCILNPGVFSEEVIITACTIIPELLAVHMIPIDDSTGLKGYIEFANKVLADNSSNVLVSSTFMCALFYLYCYNDVGIEHVKLIIEKIYSGINFDLGNEILNINNYIQNFVRKIDQEEKMQDECIEKQHECDFKPMIKKTEQLTRATVLLLKTFNEIITNTDIPTTTGGGDVDIADDDEEEEVEVLSDDGKGEIEIRISNTLNNIFSSQNYEPLKKMLNREFIEHLINFFCNLSVEEFLLNDFDKMVMLKQLLFDLEYYSLSLINNIIFNFDGILSKPRFLNK
jgi:hypothetical protein